MPSSCLQNKDYSNEIIRFTKTTKIKSATLLENTTNSLWNLKVFIPAIVVFKRQCSVIAFNSDKLINIKKQCDHKMTNFLLKPFWKLIVLFSSNGWTLSNFIQNEIRNEKSIKTRENIHRLDGFFHRSQYQIFYYFIFRTWIDDSESCCNGYVITRDMLIWESFNLIIGRPTVIKRQISNVA